MLPLLVPAILVMLSAPAAVDVLLVGAQEAPNARIQLDRMFERPTTATAGTFRNDLCGITYGYDGKTLGSALSGVAIRPALVEDSEFVNFDYEYDETGGVVVNRTLNETYPGLVPRLLDEVCERANCTWRDSYALVSYGGLRSNETFMDLLLWTTDVYDLIADWWMRSYERLDAGVVFPWPWYDATIIMVAKKDAGDEQQDAFDAFGWLAPFSFAVWGMILLTIFFSALVYWLLEVLNPDSDRGKERLDPVETTWMFATAFAGQFEFDPQTGPARLFTFSIAFWALLMGAAYTANLASFLVIRNQPGIDIETIGQAVDLGMKMCVWRSSQTDVTISSKFEKYARSDLLVRTDQRGVFEGLRDGRCEIAITEKQTWDIFQYDETINGDCGLDWIGREFIDYAASFGVKGDAGGLCTSLLSNVFTVHLHRMQGAGRIQELWDEYHRETETVTCVNNDGDGEGRRSRRLQAAADRRRLKAAQNTAAAAEGGGGGDEDTTKLSLTNMGGVFLLHGVLSAISLLCALVPWCWGRWKRRRSKDPKPQNSPPTSEDVQEEVGAASDDSNSSEKMHFFDALSKDENTAALYELRTEVTTRLNSIEEKLAALLLEKKTR